ncbi:MAG: 2-dehydropantoate 2-reductase N-terminal domain-containing protein [Anaerolineales bacterium]|jgi:glycerol-3-phosphate dehydrogenase (NAD(P)+)
MANVTIVGAGLMGTAMAWPLSDKGHHVRLVGTHLDAETISGCKKNRFHPRLNRELPRNVDSYYVEEIAAALEETDLIVSGVNSLGVHWIGRTLAPHLRPEQVILAVTKGLEATPQGDLAILPDVLAGELPPEIRDQVQYAAVGGPCIAGELAGRRQTCVVFGSRDQDCVEKLAQVFRTPYYHVWTTQDLVGLEYSAALKNVYTLGLGLVAGMLEKTGGPDSASAFMHNAAAAVFAQGCTEIERLLGVVGASTFFSSGLPGAGDLYVTGAGGRTVRLGQLLGKGQSYAEARQIMADETLESVEAVRALSIVLPKMVQRNGLEPDELPLMRALIDIVIYGKPAVIPFESFFRNMRTA